MKNIENLVTNLVLASDNNEKKKIFYTLLDEAYERGIYPWSINDFYLARGKGVFSGFTVPAINLRTMTFELARAIIRSAKKINAGAFIFEIAKSEIGYTDQSPAEYAGVCLGAAIIEDYKGPIFIQGDHFQINAKKYKENPQKEINSIKVLIQEAVNCGFYNIDIDSSTLVDLSRSTVEEQQYNNCKVCAELTEYIRSIQPGELEVSIGGEIGEVGGKNSTPEELDAFMKGYKEIIGPIYGISKISVQTGTSHGGVVLPDGSIAKVRLDFDTLKVLSKLARERYGLAGAVQHGASTLPRDAFGKFPDVETAEVHLATQFQNMVYDHRLFPKELRDKIYRWIKDNLSSEIKEGQTEEQFIYKTRKKALGPFKKDILNLNSDIKKSIITDVEEEFDFLFEKLNIKNTKELILKYLKSKPVKAVKSSEVQLEIDGEGDD